MYSSIHKNVCCHAYTYLLANLYTIYIIKIYVMFVNHDIIHRGNIVGFVPFLFV